MICLPVADLKDEGTVVAAALQSQCAGLYSVHAYGDVEASYCHTDEQNIGLLLVRGLQSLTSTILSWSSTSVSPFITMFKSFFVVVSF
jgi:hypothetical protein